MAFKLKHGGVWKDLATPYVKNGGNWVEPVEIWAKDAGVWSKVWEGLQVLEWTFTAVDNGKGQPTAQNIETITSGNPTWPFLTGTVAANTYHKLSWYAGDPSNAGALYSGYLQFSGFKNSDDTAAHNNFKTVFPAVDPLTDIHLWNETQNNLVDQWVITDARKALFDDGDPNNTYNDLAYVFLPGNTHENSPWVNRPAIGDTLKLTVTWGA